MEEWAKIRLFYAVYCFIAPQGLKNLAQGFNPGKHPIERFCPERARDGVGEMPFECYRNGIWHLLGRSYNLPLANNAHRHKVERWRAL